MSSTFLDRGTADHDGETPRPRGLLPVPPEVEQVVAREEARITREQGLTLSPEARRRLTDSLTLQHYYEDQTIAYRDTPDGVEVLAVGEQEIGDLVRRLGAEDRRHITIGQIG